MLKKIMICIPSLEYGGAERVSTYLSAYFANEGIETYLLTSKPPSENEYRLEEKVIRVTADTRRKKIKL
ncbi:MAG: hypothetical protein LUI39_10145 [Lachnospiraceae bacterium]|nr:hypothetical protein [Lachnospiraceae bacterium]